MCACTATGLWPYATIAMCVVLPCLTRALAESEALTFAHVYRGCQLPPTPASAASVLNSRCKCCCSCPSPHDRRASCPSALCPCPRWAPSPSSSRIAYPGRASPHGGRPRTPLHHAEGDKPCLHHDHSHSPISDTRCHYYAIRRCQPPWTQHDDACPRKEKEGTRRRPDQTTAYPYIHRTVHNAYFIGPAIESLPWGGRTGRMHPFPFSFKAGGREWGGPRGRGDPSSHLT